MAWWIKTIFQGRTIVLGHFVSEEEANEVGFQKLGGDFEAIELPTIDKTRATAMIKAKIFNQTASLEDALKRVGHIIPNKQKGDLENG